MTVNRIEAELRKVVLKVLDVEEREIVPAARFIDDLHADSIDVVEIVSAIENVFDVIIDDEQMGKLVTVGDVIEFLEAKGVDEENRSPDLRARPTAPQASPSPPSNGGGQ